MEKTHQTSGGTPEGVRPGSSPVTPEGFREKETAPSAKSRRKAPGQLQVSWHLTSEWPHLLISRGATRLQSARFSARLILLLVPPFDVLLNFLF